MERAGRLIGKLKLSSVMAEPETRARAAWKLAAGEKIARHTRPTMLVRGSLIVEVEDYILAEAALDAARRSDQEYGESVRGSVGNGSRLPSHAATPPTATRRDSAPHRRNQRSSHGNALSAVTEKGIGVKLTEQDVHGEWPNSRILPLTDEEIGVRMAVNDLGNILTIMWISWNELDTSNVEPMAQVLFDAEETATLREDRERPTLGNAAALANAPQSGAGYFKVPKVIER